MTKKKINAYLEGLREALQDADAATVQDALSDAEEHLSSALENAIAENDTLEPEQALERVIETYGAPQEIARAYLEIEQRVQPVLAETSKTKRSGNIFVRFFGIFVDPRAWGAFLYMFIAFATGIIYFTWAVAGISISVSFLIFIFGLPVAVLFILASRWIALLEGRIVEALLGVRMPRRPVFFPKELAWRERLKLAFTNRSTWLALIYMVLQLPLGIIYFVVMVTLLAVATAFFATPFVQSAFGEPILLFRGDFYYIPVAAYPLVFLGGVLIATITMHIAKLFGSWHGKYAKFVLVSE